MTNSKLSLKHKKIIVLGGNGLIGSAISDLFYKNGAEVLVIDKKKSKQIAKVKQIVSDISNYSKIEKTLNQIKKNHFIPDVFINCSYPKTPDWKNTNFKKVKYKYLKENIEIHLNSYIWFGKLFADLMKKNKINGSIIQLSSIYGFLGQDGLLYKNTEINESLVYPAIKGAIINSVRSMAAYYGPKKIRVNCISPGGIYDGHSKLFLKKYNDKTPMRRMCRADDIAYAALFLASDASSYITGTNLVVDGGFSII
jgi:NAD(P)-dependent dehydrogenase (short-subunit alcohol dehydrogenase family)